VLVAGAFEARFSSAMKKRSGRAKNSGFTVLELFFVILIVAVFIAMLLPARASRGRSKNIRCMSQLKQIDLSLIMFADDHQDRYPMQIPVADGGTMEFIKSDHVFPHFQKLSEYQKRPEILHCPLDSNGVAVVTYEALNDLAFADGHVEFSKSNLNLFVQQQPLGTNRFCIP
jgi:competence protein ComGC